MDDQLTSTVDRRKAKKLGSAFKPGYPQTYLKGQRRPVFRKQKAAQQRELDRLMVTKGLTKGQAMDILQKKYRKKGLRFLPTYKKRETT